MEGAIIGLIGILIGVFATEYFRRNSRVEKYSSAVFEKRLDVYEGLMKEVQLALSVVTELLGDDEMPVEEKSHIAFLAGLKVNEYCDDHKFYLNEEIAVHCGMAFVGVEDVFDPDNGEVALNDLRTAVKESYGLIRAESGIEELDGLFKSITKSSPTSRLIEGYKEIKAEHENET